MASSPRVRARGRTQGDCRVCLYRHAPLHRSDATVMLWWLCCAPARRGSSRLRPRRRSRAAAAAATAVRRFAGRRRRRRRARRRAKGKKQEDEEEGAAAEEGDPGARSENGCFFKHKPAHGLQLGERQIHARPRASGLPFALSHAKSQRPKTP